MLRKFGWGVFWAVLFGGLAFALLSPPSPAPVINAPLSAAPSPPTALNCVVILRENGKGIGQGVPITKFEMLTPNHVVTKWPLSWHGNGTYGVVRLATRNPERDMALMYSDTPLPCVVPFAEEMPKPAERLWWKLMVPGGELVPLHGFFIGIDATDGDFMVDGTTYPGTSGSVLMNERGEMVAMQHAASNLGQGVGFRAIAFASPLVGRRGAFIGLGARREP